MRYILTAIFFLVTVFISCNTDTTPLSSIPEGAFEYQGFDSSGTQIVSGWIKIDFADSNELDGTWNLNKIGNPVNIGNQIGEGTLNGSVEEEKISINLNPGIADDNVYLNGVLDGKKLEGNWHYSILVGAINSGTFKAVKN